MSNGLQRLRDYYGRQSLASSMKPAEGTREGLPGGRKILADYLHPKAMWSRFKGDPTPQEEMHLRIFEAWAMDKTPLEIAKGIDQFKIPVMDQPLDPMGAMLPAKALSQSRKLVSAYGKGMRGRGWPKLAAIEQEAVTALDMNELFRVLPPRVWEKVEKLLPAKKIPGSPQAFGVRTGTAESSIIWLSRESHEPVKNLGHEIAHHVDMVSFEGASGKFGKLRGLWNDLSDDMAAMQMFWKNRNAEKAKELYRLSPREIFARRFADAVVDEGLDFREAIKMATHQTRANMANARKRLYDSIDEANELLKRAGDPNEIPKYTYW